MDSITGHRIFLSCKPGQWIYYDPHEQSWLQLQPLPYNEHHTFIGSHKDSLAVGTELLVIGRHMDSLISFSYSTVTGTWSYAPQMITPRCLFASDGSPELAFVAGGCDFEGAILSSAELYSVSDRIWIPLPNMNRPRKYCSGFYMDGNFHVIGGANNNNELFTCGEEYDSQHGRWTVIDNMASGIQSTLGVAPLVAVVDNELYAATYPQRELKIYNKGSRQWMTIAGLPATPCNEQGWGVAFKACGRRLLLFTGHVDQEKMEIHSCQPSQGPVEWEMIVSIKIDGFVYNCDVVG